jgi:hypothetical protein
MLGRSVERGCQTVKKKKKKEIIFFESWVGWASAKGTSGLNYWVSSQNAQKGSDPRLVCSWVLCH